MKYIALLFFAISWLPGFSNSVADPFTSPNGKIMSATSPYENTVSDEELFSMAVHADPNTKVSIAKELVDRKSEKVTALFTIYLEGKQKVHVVNGALEYDSDTASELYRAVAYQKEKAERKKYYERTTKKTMQKELESLFGPDYDTKWSIAEIDLQLASLTEIALSDETITAETLNTIFRLNGFKNKNYKRVRHFAEKFPTPEILATLANFKNTADLLLFQQNIDNAYMGVSIFPHPSFFPFLKTHLASQCENSDFQNAVTAYKSPQAKTLLESVCTKISSNNKVKTQRDEKLFQLYSCIEKQNYKPYGGVLKKIDLLLQ